MDKFNTSIINYTLRKIKGREQLLNIQWHVTNKCDNFCKHCYIFDENYNVEDEISLDDAKSVIKKVYQASLYYGKPALISFIGGDPLLRNDIYELIKICNEYGIIVQVKTNPESMNDKNIKKLQSLGVKYLQFSIDGMEEMHNYFRGKGSFMTLKNAISNISNRGFIITLKYTLSKINSEEMLNVMEEVASWGITAFTFARYIPLGNGINTNMDTFSSEEYRELLTRVFEKEMNISKYSEMQFMHRDHLWELLCYEKGLYDDLLNKLHIDAKVKYGGCSAWFKTLIIDVDGECYCCRKLPTLKLGNILTHSVLDLINKKQDIGFTNLANYSQCNGCEVQTFCRSCPAASYALTGSIYNRDPCCWKNI